MRSAAGHGAHAADGPFHKRRRPSHRRSTPLRGKRPRPCRGTCRHLWCARGAHPGRHGATRAPGCSRALAQAREERGIEDTPGRLDPGRPGNRPGSRPSRHWRGPHPRMRDASSRPPARTAVPQRLALEPVRWSAADRRPITPPHPQRRSYRIDTGVCTRWPFVIDIGRAAGCRSRKVPIGSGLDRVQSRSARHCSCPK